jgi:hypothetical protein
LRIVQAERRAAKEAAEDEDSPAEEVAEAGPEPPEAVSEAPAEDVFPNDPKVQESAPQEAFESSTCDTTSGVNSEARYQAMMHALAILDAAGFAKPRSQGATGGVSG